MGRYNAEHLAAQTKEVWSEVQPLYGGDTYRVVSDKYNTNHVLLVESNLGDVATPSIIKFPAWPSKEIWGSISAEAEVLTLLGDTKTPAPLELPRLLAYNDHAPYLVASYIQGEPLSYDYIRNNFSRDEFTQFGKDIGSFIAWFGSNVSINDALAIRDLKRKWEQTAQTWKITAKHST